MGDLILRILIQYVGVGFFCVVVVDLIIRVTKSSEPFTFVQIAAAVITWPVIIFTVLNSFLKDFFQLKK